jgi:hypothetical protein
VSSTLKNIRRLQSNIETSDIELFERPNLIPAEESNKPQLLWAEVNILALPFAVLDESEAKSSSGHELIKFDRSNGKQIVWQWRVWPDPKIGMPTMATMRVLFAFMQLADETLRIQGSIPRRLEFSLSDICRRIGFEVDGRHRGMIKRHIEILVSTQCKSKGAFKDKNRNGLIIDTFKYIRQAAFAGDADEQGNTIEKNFVVFDDPVRLNLEARYIKQIDVAFMRKIASPIGQLLYTKLSHLLHDAQGHGYDYVEVKYQWLAERMGIKIYEQVWAAKKQLRQAITELVREQYIKAPVWNGFNLRFYPGVRYEFGEQLPKRERKRAAKKAFKNKKTLASNTVTVTSPPVTDPLWPLCALYSENGWGFAEKHARRHRLDEHALRAETHSRGLPLPVTLV